MPNTSFEVVGTLASVTLTATAVGMTLGLLFPRRAGWLLRFVLLLCAGTGVFIMAWAAWAGQSRPFLVGAVLLAYPATMVALRPLADAIADRLAAAMIKRAASRRVRTVERAKSEAVEVFMKELRARILLRQEEPLDQEPVPPPTEPEK